MIILPKVIYRFKGIPIKLPMVLFTEQEQSNFTSYMETQKIPNRQSSLEKERHWRNQPSRLQTVLQATVTKTAWCWHKDRNTDKRNKAENPETNPHTYGHHNFDKGGKNIQWRKDSPFNKWYWENRTATCKRTKLEHFLNTIDKKEMQNGLKIYFFSILFYFFLFLA